MKKYIVIIAAVFITNSVMPTTGNICSNVIGGNKIVGKQKMQCEGTGAGMGGPGLSGALNAVGDRIRFDTKGMQSTNLGSITSDKTISLSFPYLGSKQLYTYMTQDGTKVDILIVAYSLNMPPWATTPDLVRKRIGILTTNKKKGKASLMDKNSVLEVYRRLDNENLWEQTVEVILPADNPGDLAKERVTISPDGSITVPKFSTSVNFDMTQMSGG
ncbi:MAG TPA: hypothetical protein VEK38_04510 [Candidatus Bathyarchaeia archaeon]|nr:hypothetical protein [Candidatus Bathyarchaeia archaeon]